MAAAHPVEARDEAGAMAPARHGTQPAHALRVPIEKSWERCRGFGLAEGTAPDFSRVGAADLSEALEASRAFTRRALPVMETLRENLAETGSMVVLTDSRGLVLYSLGDGAFLKRAHRIALSPGALWSEECKGTNAIGTGLFEEGPVLVHAGEHFFAANRFLTCSAAPILEPSAMLGGVLDVTGDYRGYHRHTMALVQLAARLVENSLFVDAFPDAVTLRFHERAELIGTLHEGIAVFAEDGAVVAANRSALVRLGLHASDLRHHRVDSLFGVSIGALLGFAARPGGDHPQRLAIPSGAALFVRAEAGPRVRMGVRIYVSEMREPASAPLAARTQELSSPQEVTLASLDLGDERIHHAIERIHQVTGSDIPVLIQGETGTGKELFARAIHALSPRRAGPFVAVDCASIPDGLIESELFGYEEGAFTGARRRGAVGKIQVACGGTLFLDEIGDMPLNLQARLLRVLQERVVMPLGSVKAHPVDVALICATNRKLRERMRTGQFREDLYYRLNGLVIALPALRERTDLRALVRYVLDTQVADGMHYRIGSDVMAIFERHPWPGNCRQLANLLRTATVLARDVRVIERCHLPEDFFEDLEEDARAACARDAAPGPVSAPLHRVEHDAIRACIARCNGNISGAARELGISRNTVYRKLRRAG